MSPLQDFVSTIIDSFGSFLTAMFTGLFNIFLGPLWTAIAQALGLPAA